MVRQRPRPSALSAPQNFISESLARRLYRGHRRVLWGLVAVLGAAGALLGSERVGALRPWSDAPPPSRPPDVPVQELVRQERDLVARLKALDEPTDRAAKPAEAKETELSAPEPAPKEASPRSAPARERDETTASVLPVPAAPEADKAVPRGPDAIPGSDPGPTQTLERAGRYLGRGQYTIARYLYEEAYRAGEVQGALGMAKSYDAAYLRSIGLQAKGDPQRARIWYRRAAGFGDRSRRSTP